MKEEYNEVQGNKIRILDKDTINKIAAGEVIERPASVVKELIDNSIDAGATEIRIEVEKGGKNSILIRDNGCGMSRADALLAYKKHATSKLTRIEDLDTISTMGFRGEALASITAIAKVEILTRPPEEITGTKILVHGGKVVETSDAGTAPGTSVYVKDLFYNTPARRKYLKSDRTELAHITDIITQLALANPEISFTLLNEGKPVIRNAGSKDIFNSIVNLLGPDTARSMLPLEHKTEDFEIRGYISKPETTRAESDYLFLFVNTRPVTSKAINNAVRTGYYTKIPKGRYPVAVLSLILDPQEVDVNVHPRKAEVRFSREKELGDAVTFAVEKVLSEHGLMPEIRNKESAVFQKTFEALSPSERARISEKLSEQGLEARESLKKAVEMEATIEVELPKSSGFPDLSSKIIREKAENYTYPVKDTERKLKRSERFLASAGEKGSFEPSEEKGQDLEKKENGKEIQQESEKKTEYEIGKEGRKLAGEELEREGRKLAGEELERESRKLTGEELERESRKLIGEELERESRKLTGGKFEKENRQDREVTNTAGLQKAKQKPNTDSLENLRIIGQVSKIYILAEKGEDLILIDQHAAHERILYEQVLKIKKSRVQELIAPVTIDLTPKEKVLMEEYIPYLEEYGFGISEFGDNTFVVTFVPDIFGRLENPEVIHDVISDLLSSGKVKKDTGISEKVCKTLACRAAIKGGAACSLRQMEELIEQLKKADNPYSCPHGRPTVVTLTKGELDRMFARIQ